MNAELERLVGLELQKLDGPGVVIARIKDDPTGERFEAAVTNGGYLSKTFARHKLTLIFAPEYYEFVIVPEGKRAKVKHDDT